MNVLLNESRIMNQESRQRRGSPKAARVLAGETSQKIDQEVLLKGWVRTRRDHGKLIFLDLRDRSGVVQLVVNPQVSEGAHKVSQELRPEYVIEVRGEVKKRPENTINKDLPTGEVEVEVKGLTILSKAETLPFDMGGEELNLELPTLLDNRTLTLRKALPKFLCQQLWQLQQRAEQKFFLLIIINIKHIWRKVPNFINR
ncbi:MAG: hypothetical protein HYS68_02990 [Candidatus Levybacteria bacterium]|nr:hypothetical protein [Candidatus Levybacteria bacterium]